MHIDDALIDKLARLSRLSFNAEEKQAIKKDLEKMIDFVARLQQVDCSHTAPLTHMSVANNVTRPDIATGAINQQDALKNAANTSQGFFKVPRVIKK